jgi:hypothetical protein
VAQQARRGFFLGKAVGRVDTVAGQGVCGGKGMPGGAGGFGDG